MTHGIRNAGPASWGWGAAGLAFAAACIWIPMEIRATRSALLTLAESAKQGVLAQATNAAARSDAQLTGARSDLTRVVARLATTADARLASVQSLLDTRSAEALKLAESRLAAAQGSIDGLRLDLSPVLANAAALEARYTALPDQLSATFAPTWAGLEPEFTCIKHGNGYGGCWHSRVTALMGEAAGVGGIFRAKFPELSTSINGIAGNFNGISKDVHTFTTKAVAPRGFWGRFKDVLTTTSGVARAGAAAGLFDVRRPYHNPYLFQEQR